MCGLCGSLGGTDWTDGVAAAAASTPTPARRTSRRERVTSANRVLAVAGLSLADWQGSAFVLRARTGASVPVRGLLDLWQQADRLGPRLDPLDPDLLARIA